MQKHIFIFICIILFTYTVKSQTNTDDVNKFLKAEELYLNKEYNNALSLYSELLKSYPSNNNLYYKIGLCYLNDLKINQIRKSIYNLEIAVENIDSTNYRECNFDELKASPDAYYYLAKAYKLNNNFDKAINSLETYKTFIEGKNNVKSNFINKEIEALKNEKANFDNPVELTLTRLEKILKFPYEIDNYPLLSKDGNILIYTIGTKNNSTKDDNSSNQLDRIYFSKKINDEWSEPEDISIFLNFTDKTIPVSLSADGTDLFLVQDDNDNGNIYVSHFHDGKWNEMTKLNENINSKLWETHASISNDGKTLYFTSERPGGYGGLDIYKSELDANGDWGKAINLGPKINTKYKEEVPFYIEEENKLFFCSQGHYSIGGFDFFSSKLSNDTWSEPFNYGNPMNSYFDDFIFVLKADSNYIFFPIFINVKSKKNYNCFILNEANPIAKQNEYKLKGTVTFEDSINKPYKNLFIVLIDSLKSDTIDIITTNQLSGQYSYNLLAGSYNISFQADGYETYYEHLFIPSNYDKNEIVRDVKLKPTGLIVSYVNKVNENIVIDTTVNNNIIKANNTNAIKTNENVLNDTTVKENNNIVNNENNINININNNVNNANSTNVNKVNENETINNINDTNENKTDENNKNMLVDRFTVRNIYFDFGSSKLNYNSIYELNRIANLMRTFPELTVTITGYTDSKEDNEGIADKRVLHALNFLISHEVSSNRITTKALFKTGYIATNENQDGSDNTEGRKYNRRVGFLFNNVSERLILTYAKEVPQNLIFKGN